MDFPSDFMGQNPMRISDPLKYFSVLLSIRRRHHQCGHDKSAMFVKYHVGFDFHGPTFVKSGRLSKMECK